MADQKFIDDPVFEQRDDKTQELLSFGRGEMLPLRGGWFKVISANGRRLTLELVGLTGKAKKKKGPKRKK